MKNSEHDTIRSAIADKIRDIYAGDFCLLIGTLGFILFLIIVTLSLTTYEVMELIVKGGY